MKHVGIIGAGDVVANRLLPALLKVDWIDEVSVFFDHIDEVSSCLNESNRQAVFVSNIGSQTPDDLAKLTLDAVFIATPPESHLTYIEAFLRTGIPVICEKPLFIGASDAARIHMLGDALDRLFALSYYVQEKALPLAWLVGHDPDSLGLLQPNDPLGRTMLLDAYAALGELKAVEVAICEGAAHSRTRSQPFWFENQPNGVWFDMGVHIAMLAQLVGKQKLAVRVIDASQGPSYHLEASCGSVPLTARFGKGFPLGQVKRNLIATYENGQIECDFDKLSLQLTFEGTPGLFELSVKNRGRYECLVLGALNFLQQGGRHKKKHRTDSLNLQLEAIEFLHESWQAFSLDKS